MPGPCLAEHGFCLDICPLDTTRDEYSTAQEDRKESNCFRDPEVYSLEG